MHGRLIVNLIYFVMKKGSVWGYIPYPFPTGHATGQHYSFTSGQHLLSCTIARKKWLRVAKAMESQYRSYFFCVILNEIHSIVKISQHTR